ncbi:transcriptional regulator, XRE family with cupin sensor [Shimia marina]|uniref:HTH-type transcriptional regulator PuuR n=2 Tax=Shimia marina TaxID=321267 RepID=A0A0P1FBB2_9RHOB|nr:HTH-type transcriptional regulator PuuR [Shimia marina]SFD43986.1 transcriptional regulator, XRE family with cupin sensor [Shimia marina]
MKSAGTARHGLLTRSPTEGRRRVLIDKGTGLAASEGMDTDLPILDLLPARLREARRAQGLSLDAVAKLSGVSRSMVSQIERGESSPTIATLWNLTRALQVDFAGLLDADAADKVEVLRASDVPRFDNMGHLCLIHILSPPEDVGGHEVYDIRFEAGGHLKSAPHKRGATEQLTVLEGAVRVSSGAAAQDLATGDTARYAADVVHSIEATQPARVFLIVKNG